MSTRGDTLPALKKMKFHCHINAVVNDLQYLRKSLAGRVMEKISFIVLLLICLAAGELASRGNTQLADCKESDREALLNLKGGLEDSESRLSLWQGRNCCQWWGIACDNKTGAVIAVDLHNPYPSGYDSSGRYGFWNLSGEIRPSLTKMKSLRHLDLSFNTFNGSIPDFFSLLENLRYLNISNAGFSGVIPPNLGNLSSLQILDVSSNYVGFIVNNLEWITSLVSLQYLEMSGSNLSMVGLGWAEALNKLPVLTELHLAACGLSSFTPSLPSVNFSSLAVLDLSGNNFISKLPDWLPNISSLVTVDISSSRLYGRIPLGFSELPNLQSLKLGSNDNLTASCYQLFRGSWKRIEVLDFSLNKLHGKLPAAIGNLTSLIYLNLFYNKITGSIPSSFGKLCSLQFVDLSANNLTGSLPQFLEGTEDCPSKRPFPILQNFVCSDNHLVGNLPSWLGQLENLVVLNVQYNLLEGPIPPSFGNLRHLSELRLEANKLNGTLPDNLGQLSELTVLDVSINQLTGIISESHFSRLKKLEILILSANSFILNVSANWIPPFQVWFLDMGSCHLGPSFPSWLRSQKQLNFLDVSNTSIAGALPIWLWDMSGNLSLLNVSLNQLDGQIPNPFSIAPSAAVDFSSNFFEGPIPLPSSGVVLFDLSSNNFSGTIPFKIGTIMPNLVFLSLSDNQLTGKVPSTVGELLSLEVIDLSRNSLTGSIPPSIGNCSQLKVLDLQNNNLSGLIPVPLGELNLLQTLHLSNNKFSGQVPSSLQNLSSLETLDLGNNRLTGEIPSWIGSAFPHLRILSLRANAFSGEIPSALSNLSSLQVLDLAGNELNGSIPATFGNLKAMAWQQYVNRYLFYGEVMTHYYPENFVVNIQGQLRKYTKTLSLLTSIDVSGNNLSGDLPQEITKLVGLVVLNLSRNHMSGQIPQSISELHQLLSLDLSGNNFSGPIPLSMSSLTFLGYLNLSSNNFSGRIPYTNQMTTFNASSFSGNPGLCGDPLAITCPGEDSSGGRSDGSNSGRPNNPDHNNGFVDKWFYLSIGVGYAAGLLVPFFLLATRRRWSNAYFAVVENVADRILSSPRSLPAARRTQRRFPVRTA